MAAAIIATGSAIAGEFLTPLVLSRKHKTIIETTVDGKKVMREEIVEIEVEGEGERAIEGEQSAEGTTATTSTREEKEIERGEDEGEEVVIKKQKTTITREYETGTLAK